MQSAQHPTNGLAAEVPTILLGLLLSLMGGALAAASQLRERHGLPPSGAPARMPLILVASGFAPGLAALLSFGLLFIAVVFGVFHWVLTGAPPQGWWR